MCLSCLRRQLREVLDVAGEFEFFRASTNAPVNRSNETGWLSFRITALSSSTRYAKIVPL
jgi:hypothetical protein